MEKASKRIEADKTIAKVANAGKGPPPAKRRRFSSDKSDLRHFLDRGASARYGSKKEKRHQPYTPSQNRSPTGTSTSPDQSPNNQPPRGAPPRATSTPSASFQWTRHSSYMYWYNSVPSAKYPYIAAGRTPSLLLAQLVSPHERSMDPTVCPGLSFGAHPPTHPADTATRAAVVSKESPVNRQGDSQAAHQTCCGQGSASGGRVCEPNLLSSEEGWHTEASGQLEASQSLHSETTLQDGRSPCSQRFAAEGRLDGLGRPEGCLPVSADIGGIQEVSPLPMGQPTLPVSVHAVWVEQCSTDVHKDSETDHGTPEAERGTFDGVYRRHPSDGTVPS